MYMLLKNKNSCWGNIDKKGFLLFLTKQLLPGTRPTSEIQIIFLMSRACGLGFVLFCFFPDFLILAFILFFWIILYVLSAWEAEISGLTKHDRYLLKPGFWFSGAKNALSSCTAGGKTEKVHPCSINVSGSQTEGQSSLWSWTAKKCPGRLPSPPAAKLRWKSWLKYPKYVSNAACP